MQLFFAASALCYCYCVTAIVLLPCVTALSYCLVLLPCVTACLAQFAHYYGPLKLYYAAGKT
jgi:hypothetical protein